MIHYLSLQQLPDTGDADGDRYRALAADLAPLERSLPGLVSRTVSRVYDRTHRQLSMAPADIPVDAVTRLCFADYTALRQALASSAFQRRREVLVQTMARSTGLVVLSNEVIPRPAAVEGAPWLKRMGLFQIKEGVSREAFRRWWFEQHGPSAANLPQLKAYVQNAVVDAVDERDPARELPAMRCDGVTEMWFEDLSAMEAAFPHRTATKITQQASGLTERIATVLIEEDAAA